jgi:FkbM family methyltransferase
MDDVPYSIVLPTAYGSMILHRLDINQTGALLKTGRSIDHDEILLLRRFIGFQRVHKSVIDIGANFGTFALGLAREILPTGKVYAFEPQRIICNMLAGSVALNALHNVYCFNMAVGHRQGLVEIPQFDYHRPLNFGSVEFGATQRERLDQERTHDPEKVERVPLVTLDQLALPDIGLVKIDAEGMENEVLDGAQLTIRNWRPLLFVEFIKVDAKALRDRLAAMGYDVYAHRMNFLGVPGERRSEFPVGNE